MGEAKRRKVTHAAAFIPPPNVIRRGDAFSQRPTNTPTGAEKAHLSTIRQDCRRQSRKALKAAQAATDMDARTRALQAILLGTNLALEQQLQDFYQGNRNGPQIQRRIACSMGCNSCCYVTVEASVVEAIAIALAVKTNHPDLIETVAATAPKVAGLDPVERMAKKIPCPLLKKGLCSVHELRPVKCRAVLSFDAKPCMATLAAATSEEQQKIAIPRFGLPGVIEPFITEGVRLACADEGLQSCTVELVGALHLIFSDPTAVDRWLGGEAVFQPYN